MQPFSPQPKPSPPLAPAADDRARITTEVPEDLALIASLQEYVPLLMERSSTPGLNLAVARRGRLIWEQGFGMADVESRRAMTADTTGRAGSISKLYTATAVMQLVESGDLELHAPVNRYLTEFRVCNPRGRRDITIYDLLTFRSGLATGMPDSDIDPPPDLGSYLQENLSRIALREYSGALPQWARPVGDAYQYSNIGIALLGYLVEISNPFHLSFSDYVRHRILEPLGMSLSVFPPVVDRSHVPTHIARRMSTGYARFGSLLLPTPTVHSAPYPCNGLVTAPRDHLRLLLAYQQGGSLDGCQLLRQDSIQQMLTPQDAIAEPDVAEGYWTGLCIMMSRLDQEGVHFGHSGAHMWGWWNDSRVYPRLDLTMAVFTNQWDMLSWHNPGMYEAASVVCDLASAWLVHSRRSARWQEEPKPWNWRISYAIGLVMAERMWGLLAITPNADDLNGGGLCSLSAVAGTCETGVSWSPTGFECALADIRDVEPTPTGIRAFLGSDRVRVNPAELRLANILLGGQGELPVPLSFWSSEVSDLHGPTRTR